MNRFLIFILIVFALSFQVNGDTLSIERSDWEEKAQALDFSEDVQKKEVEEEEKPLFKPAEAPTPSSSILDLQSVKTILFGVLIVAALIVIILIIKNAKAPANISKDRIQATSLEEAEDNLPEVELNHILNEAITAENWKVALRIQFLMLLQELIYANLIVWKKRKTNEQFADEINDGHVKSEFLTTVNVFDPAWYGNKEISEKEFNDVNSVILSLTKSVANGK